MKGVALKIIRLVLLVLAMNGSYQVQASIEEDIDKQAKKQFEQIFSTTVLLSDSESISFGVANFDPSTVFSNDNGSDVESIKRRNELKVYSIPISWKINPQKYWFDQLITKFSYINQTEKQEYGSEDRGQINTEKDISTDYIFSSYAGLSKRLSIDKHWSARVGLGSYFMYHDNDHQYNSSESEERKDVLDGVINNTHASALVIEPFLKIDYQLPKNWGYWKWQSHVSIFTGTSLSGPNSVHGIRPEGWKFLNGIRYFYDLDASQARAEELFFKFQRVDLNGDMVETIGTHYFYEIGGGILFDVSRHTNLIENIGIGININKGSDLNGGSIVIYFNEL